MVLAEADILGKPVVSTDIAGARDFMQEHGGVLVENSMAGIQKGLFMLSTNAVQPMHIDYEAYNRDVVCEFESML